MEALISVSGKVYYSSKTKKIFLTRFSKRATTKDQRQNSPKALRNGQNGTLVIMIYLFIRPMPPDRLVVVDSETQEIAWRRSQVDHFDRYRNYFCNLRTSPEQGSEEVQVQNQEGKRAMSRISCGGPGSRR